MISSWRRGGLLAGVAGYSFEKVVRIFIIGVVGIFVARYLGPAGLGLIAYAGSVFGLLGSFTQLGMRPILVREFSTRKDWRVVLASALSRQLPVAILVSIASSVVIMTTRGFDHDAILVTLAMLPLPLLGLTETFRAFLESIGRVRVIVVVGVVAVIIASTMKIVAILLGAPVWVFALATTVGSALVAVGLLGSVRGHWVVGAIRRHYERAVASDLLSESWPLLLAGVAVTIYMRIDVVMLGMLSGDTTVGIYTAAARLSEVWYFLPTSAMAAIRPKLARLFASREVEQYQMTTQRFMSAAFGVSAIIVVGILLFGDPLVTFLYGSAYSAARIVLRIHVLSTPFVFLGVAASQWFIDRGLTKAVLLRSVIGAAINIVVNLFLIPPYGATGAAIATLVSYAMSSVMVNALDRRTRHLFGMQMRALVLAQLSNRTVKPS